MENFALEVVLGQKLDQRLVETRVNATVRRIWRWNHIEHSFDHVVVISIGRLW
jgi:hypothetical protein